MSRRVANTLRRRTELNTIEWPSISARGSKVRHNDEHEHIQHLIADTQEPTRRSAALGHIENRDQKQRGPPDDSRDERRRARPQPWCAEAAALR